MSKTVPLTKLQMDQCERWRAGQRVLVENYLRQEPALGTNSEALLDLIYQEIMLRQERGETPILKEYEQRFPRLSKELRLQFEVHQALEGSALLGATAVRSARAEMKPAFQEIGPQNQGKELLIGRTLGDCKVVGFLGQGAMGWVYLGEQTGLGRPVALKVLRADLVSNAATLQRFQAEARAMARAAHPNIVQIHSIGEAKGLHYLVMEYIDGPTLRQELADKGRMEALPALAILRQVAAALERAGELGIVHRDIKPENILLTARGEAKVSDFGLCWSAEERRPKLTVLGVALGTPLYMSPEQVQSRPVDQRSDIYSLGATCYQMLAGVPPFQGTNAVEVALQHLENVPAPLASHRPDLPASLCAIVHRMLAKKPEDRFPSARALLDQVDEVTKQITAISETLINQQAITQPVLKGTTPARPRRRKLLWLAAALLLLALGVGFALDQFLNAPDETGSPTQEPIPSGSTSGPAKEENAEKSPSDKEVKPNPSVNPVESRDKRGGHRHGGRDRPDSQIK